MSVRTVPGTGTLLLLGALALSLVVSACATTRQTRSVEQTGFLGDYSQLRPGEGDEAQLIYIDARADFSSYDAVIIDSVTLWGESEAAKLPPKEGQALTDYLYQALHDQLSQDYKIVGAPGPGVLRLRVAIAEAKGSNVVGNSVTTVIPQLRMLSTLTGVSSDTQVFVGKAAIEGEITDSITSRRLMAAVDERAGGKTIRGGLAKWSDVKNAFDFWAQRLRTRLQEERGR
jgi:hypothetical protein